MSASATVSIVMYDGLFAAPLIHLGVIVPLLYEGVMALTNGVGVRAEAHE